MDRDFAAIVLKILQLNSVHPAGISFENEQGGFVTWGFQNNEYIKEMRESIGALKDTSIENLMPIIFYVYSNPERLNDEPAFLTKSGKMSH